MRKRKRDVNLGFARFSQNTLVVKITGEISKTVVRKQQGADKRGAV